MNVRYRVELSQIERTELKALLSGGKHASRKLKRAQILLAADAGASDKEIARSVGVGGSTVYRTKRRQSGASAERRAASRGGTQTHGQGQKPCWWVTPDGGEPIEPGVLRVRILQRSSSAFYYLWLLLTSRVARFWLIAQV